MAVGPLGKNMIKTIKKDNLEIKMLVDTEYEEHRFQNFFEKEPETVDWIKTFINPGEIFYDLGANIGVYSLLAGEYHKNKVKIYSFEPVYHNFDKLCRNIIVNNYQDTITPYCLAVGEKTGSDIINLVSNVSGSANHWLDGTTREANSEPVKTFRQGVLVVSLDDLVSRYNFPVPNHIKIDTDGFEEKIIKGGLKLLADKRLKSVLIEITDIQGVKERIIKIMESCGLKASHSINFQENHSRFRRIKNGHGNISNIIFTK